MRRAVELIGGQELEVCGPSAGVITAPVRKRVLD